MHKNRKSKSKVVLSILLSVVMVCSVITVGTVSMSAQSNTAIGLCNYALNAYNEGWPYVWGGASYGAVDCTGLIKAYNSEIGGIRTDMVTSSQDAGLDWGYVYEGIPNIHGLGLHKPGHVGIYVGSGQAIDARGTNWGIVYGSLSAQTWVEWYKLVGVSYPENGWVEFDGQSYYYEDGEYIDSTSRTIDGVTYYFNSLGVSSKRPPESAYDEVSTSTDSKLSGTAEITDNPATYLKTGSQGDRVREVQQLLKDHGYFDDDVTGYYGTYTTACVKEFQTDADIEVDGVVGSEFMRTIKSDNAPSKKGADTSDEEPEEEIATEVPTEAPTQAPTEAPTEEVTAEEVTTEEVTEVATVMTENVDDEEEDPFLENFDDEDSEKEATEATEEATEQVTEKATEAVTEKPTEEPTSAPTEAPTETPTEAPTEAPTLPENPLYDGVINCDEYDVDGNSDIADMQKRLAELGYYKSEVTGVFDDDTLEALHEYFKKSDIREEDYITQEQYDVLMSDSAIAKDKNSGYSEEKIANVQRTLKKLGYLESSANESGVYDTSTSNAVKTAQANMDTAVTGELSDSFVKSLEMAEASFDSQAKTTQSNTTKQSADSSANVTSGNTVEVSGKTAPKTGYTFMEAVANNSTDDVTMMWVIGMIVALALGTTVVYTKRKVSSKK